MLYIKTKKLTKKSRTYAACRGFFLYSTVKHPYKSKQIFGKYVREFEKSLFFLVICVRKWYNTTIC